MTTGHACSHLIKFRRSHPSLGRAEFLDTQDITWHESNWHDQESRFLAFTLHDRRAHVPAQPGLLVRVVPGTPD